MSEITVKCPTCGKICHLKSDKEITAQSTFICPVCKEKHIVGNCQRVVVQKKSVVPSSDETNYGPAPSARGDETQIGPQPQGAGGDETQIGASPRASIGVLVDSMGRTYQLKSGVNTIGRKATSSPASVQIETNDRTMSRNHAVIEVRNAGGQMLHILKNGANKNPSYINNALIAANDQLILNNGDRMKFGETILVMVKK